MLEVPPGDADADHARGEALRALQKVNQRPRPAPVAVSTETAVPEGEGGSIPEAAPGPAVPFSIEGLVAVLARELAIGPGHQRQAAVRTLGELGPAASAATDAVWALAEDPDPELAYARGEAVRLLARWHGPVVVAPEPGQDPEARSALVALATDDEDASVRASAVQMLAQMEAVSADLLSVARRAAADPDSRVRMAAVQLLARLGG